jgi:DNA-directed RNA polymerase beta' subunit
LGSYSHTFRKEGYTKIIEYGLTPKQKNAHRALGIRRPDVLGSRFTAETQLDVDAVMEDVSSDEEDEGQGQATMSDVEEEGDVPRAVTGKAKTKRGRNERLVTPEEIREHMRRLFRNEAAMCTMIYGRHGQIFSKTEGRAAPTGDMFFLDVIPVSPTRFRPPARMGETLFEHSHNELLGKTIRTSYRLRDTSQEIRLYQQNEKPDPLVDVNRLWSKFLDDLIQLQVDVNSFIDSSKNPTPMRQGKLPPPGIKQGLEKKEGLFRKNMMVCSISCQFTVTNHDAG